MCDFYLFIFLKESPCYMVSLCGQEHPRCGWQARLGSLEQAEVGWLLWPAKPMEVSKPPSAANEGAGCQGETSFRGPEEGCPFSR